MARERAIRKLECVPIRRKQTAAHVTMGAPVLRQTRVSREFARDQIQLLARHPINVTTQARAIRVAVFVRIRRRQTAPPATTAISAPRATVVRAEYANQELRTRLATVKSPLKAIGRIIPRPGAC